MIGSELNVLAACWFHDHWHSPFVHRWSTGGYREKGEWQVKVVIVSVLNVGFDAPLKGSDSSHTKSLHHRWVRLSQLVTPHAFIPWSLGLECGHDLHQTQLISLTWNCFQLTSKEAPLRQYISPPNTSQVHPKHRLPLRVPNFGEENAG